MKKRFLLLGCLALSILVGQSLYAQEEQSAEVFLEEYTDEFQENFFEALKQKGIQNYDRAINLLIKCKQLEPSNSVIDYELGKMYCLDKQYIKGEEYAIEALIAQPTDFWYLESLINVLEKQGKPLESVQASIPYENRKLKENLAVVYFRKKNYDDAKKVLLELGKSKFTDQLTAKINDSIQQKEKKLVVHPTKQDPGIANEDDPVADYSGRIEQMLLESDYEEMKAISKEALDAYPLQPYFYYAYGTALNRTSDATKAITVLESGLDYLLDDGQLANKIYGELSNAYRSIGNATKANEYANKIKQGL
ncbi:tetratricopeptide repeat protein [Flagellimonas nanhaiensis]|uniref:Tetratricopeptide repeat protein n=1 Tax=Flagellimonas nanhaiensis TaxID=2292706 RepID=A0A371JQS9_9FLAO|nr:hypothetical protein [Allomuricauda nanhaiensis]RDY59867.1 hypothetical protein DX873_10970 [Allomuricauda nanhaiensis]